MMKEEDILMLLVIYLGGWKNEKFMIRLITTENEKTAQSLARYKSLLFFFSFDSVFILLPFAVIDSSRGFQRNEWKNTEYFKLEACGMNEMMMSL